MFLSELLAPAGFPLFFQAPGLSAAHGSLRPSLGTLPPPPCPAAQLHVLSWPPPGLPPASPSARSQLVPPSPREEQQGDSCGEGFCSPSLCFWPVPHCSCLVYKIKPIFFFSADLIPLKFLMFCIQRPNNGFCLLSKYEAVSHSLCSWLPAPSSPDSLEVECSRHRLLKFPS